MNTDMAASAATTHYQMLPALEPDQLEDLRQTLLRHGSDGFPAVREALAYINDLRFTAINPAVHGRATSRGSRPAWVMADVRPATTFGYWWVGVIEYGTSIIATNDRRPIFAGFVPDLLAHLRVGDCHVEAHEAQPTAVSPWTEKPAEKADKRTVYFIQPVGGGLIKIGVAGDPRSRLATLSLMSPIPLRILAVIPGVGQAMEAELHQRFGALREHGEWFRPEPELLSYIAERGA